MMVVIIRPSMHSNASYAHESEFTGWFATIVLLFCSPPSSTDAAESQQIASVVSLLDYRIEKPRHTGTANTNQQRLNRPSFLVLFVCRYRLVGPVAGRTKCFGWRLEKQEAGARDGRRPYYCCWLIVVNKRIKGGVSSDIIPHQPNAFSTKIKHQTEI